VNAFRNETLAIPVQHQEHVLLCMPEDHLRGDILINALKKSGCFCAGLTRAAQRSCKATEHRALNTCNQVAAARGIPHGLVQDAVAKIVPTYVRTRPAILP